MKPLDMVLYDALTVEKRRLRNLHMQRIMGHTILKKNLVDLLMKSRKLQVMP